ncbi:MAG: nuclear transport factor 2 family protein [Desulfobulbaceae bacterium]|nr:nuclear transport factor 2 family protein [Desulfobulbaceae bacterium]
MAAYQWDWPHTRKWPRFSGEKIDIVKKMFLAGEALNVDNFIKFFTDDCYYQFGNFPPARSPQEIASSSTGFIEKCEGLHHHIVGIWEASDGTLFCEMEVTYINHAGKVVTLPCCDIIRFEGDKVKELKIFMDINPLFNA